VLIPGTLVSNNNQMKKFFKHKAFMWGATITMVIAFIWVLIHLAVKDDNTLMGIGNMFSIMFLFIIGGFLIYLAVKKIWG